MPFGSIVYSPPYFKIHSLVFYIISSFIYNYKLKKSAFLSGIRVSKMLSGIRCFTLYSFYVPALRTARGYKSIEPHKNLAHNLQLWWKCELSIVIPSRIYIFEYLTRYVNRVATIVSLTEWNFHVCIQMDSLSNKSMHESIMRLRL
jgi:hypothetical protein